MRSLHPARELLEERAALIQALGELGSPKKELVSALMEELENPLWAIRAAAANSLGRLKAKEAKAALEARLTDFYQPVRLACKKALEQLKGLNPETPLI